MQVPSRFWDCGHDPSRQAYETLTTLVQILHTCEPSNVEKRLNSRRPRGLRIRKMSPLIAARWKLRVSWSLDDSTEVDGAVLPSTGPISPPPSVETTREKQRRSWRSGYLPRPSTLSPIDKVDPPSGGIPALRLDGLWKLWKPCVLPRHQSTGIITPRPRSHTQLEAEGFRFRAGDEPESCPLRLVCQ